MANMLNRYLIAIIPPEDINEQIRRFQLDMAERFQSSKALKNVPHITLKAPFQIDNEEHTKVVKWFELLQTDVAPFTVELNGFGNFSNSARPVIYGKPVKNLVLDRLQKELMQQFASAFPGIKIAHTEKEFSPHITIAYRDLTPEFFTKAWSAYEVMSFDARFPVNGFYLLHHDGNSWKMVCKYNLSPSLGTDNHADTSE
jgi:2'-5' RNA ligase